MPRVTATICVTAVTITCAVPAQAWDETIGRVEPPQDTPLCGTNPILILPPGELDSVLEDPIHMHFRFVEPAKFSYSPDRYYMWRALAKVYAAQERSLCGGNPFLRYSPNRRFSAHIGDPFGDNHAESTESAELEARLQLIQVSIQRENFLKRLCQPGQ